MPPETRRQPRGPTLGLYITTKGIVGQCPRILTANGRMEWIVGRSTECSDVIMPHRHISREHGRIVYDPVDNAWRYQHVGQNATYLSKDGSPPKRMVKGQDAIVNAGDSVSLLFREPMYAIEFMPDIRVDPAAGVDNLPTESKNSTNDIAYIDTKVELLAYVVKVLAGWPWYKLAILALAVVAASVAITAWLVTR